MHKILVSLLIIWLLLPLPLSAQAKDGEKNTKKTRKPAPISRYIPGLHQLKNKKYLKGGLLTTSFLCVSVAAVVFNHRGNQWYQKYQDSGNVNDVVLFRKKAERSFKNRNIAIVGIFTIWLVHILDIKLSRKATLNASINPGHAVVGFTFRF